MPFHISLYRESCQANREGQTRRRSTSFVVFMPTAVVIEKRLETTAAETRLNRNLAGCRRCESREFLRLIGGHHHTRCHCHIIPNDCAALHHKFHPLHFGNIL
jgi:hypothetical protein